MKRSFGLVLAFLVMVTWVGCSSAVTPHKKDYGLGECTEYVPPCYNGSLSCTNDEKGCRICECQQREQFPPPSHP